MYKTTWVAIIWVDIHKKINPQTLHLTQNTGVVSNNSELRSI